MKKKLLFVLLVFFIIVFLLLGVFAYLFFSSRYFTFDHQFIVNRPTTQVWQDFSRAFTDSRQTDFWPNELSNVVSAGLRKNGLLTVTYMAGAKQTTVQYVFTQVQIGQVIKYQTNDNHPLIGLGEIYFIDQGDKTKINWKGEFGLQDFSLAGIYAKYFYVNQFFEALGNNLN